MPTGFHLVSPAHSTVCIVDRSALIFLSLPSIHSRICTWMEIKIFKCFRIQKVSPRTLETLPLQQHGACGAPYLLQAVSFTWNALSPPPVSLFNSSPPFKYLLWNFIVFIFESLNFSLSPHPSINYSLLKQNSIRAHTTSSLVSAVCPCLV